MKLSQTENILVFVEVPSFWRGVGFFFLILAVSAFIFAYFGAIYFGADDTSSIITYAIISVLFGLGFLLPACILLSAPDQKLEINRLTGKISLTEKLIRTTHKDFSFAEIEKFEITQIDGENITLYLAQIFLRGGEIITIPSNNLGDKEEQLKLIEQVRNILEKVV